MARGKYLQGLPSLLKKLEKLKKQTADGVKAAMAQSGEEITATMRRVVPEGIDNVRELKDSIRYYFVDDKGDRIIMRIAAGDKKAFYAKWVEFGTAPHDQGGIFKGGVHPGNTPQPFFFPSYRAGRNAHKRRMNKAIRDEVKKAVA